MIKHYPMGVGHLTPKKICGHGDVHFHPVNVLWKSPYITTSFPLLGVKGQVKHTKLDPTSTARDPVVVFLSPARANRL